jgi:hypothetical protein
MVYKVKSLIDNKIYAAKKFDFKIEEKGAMFFQDR